MDLALPLDWHSDGTPIFNRGDIIRPPRSLPPDGVIYDNLVLSEHRHLRPELEFNLIVIPPREANVMAPMVWLGKSYPDSRRGFVFGRVIQALDSNCMVIMQRWTRTGIITDFVKLHMQPFHLAVVPSSYEAVLVNSLEEKPARFFELRAEQEVRNTDTIAGFDGPGYLPTKDGGLQPNDNYSELPIPRIHPGLDGFKFMDRRSLYEMFTHYPKGFDFIDPPKDEFFVGAV